MNAQGEKTGGRQKGTPNKVNASVKLRVKDFLFKNEELMQEAFEKAKPGERLNFYYKMLNLVCAKQTSSKDDGEWRPGDDIDTEWTSGLEKYRRQSTEPEEPTELSADNEKKTADTVNKGPETATVAKVDNVIEAKDGETPDERDERLKAMINVIEAKDGETPDEREERLKAMMIPQTAATPLTIYQEKLLHDNEEYRHLVKGIVKPISLN